MKLTATTTREAYASHLREAATTKFGTNAAIAAHAKKVEAMSKKQWVEHRAKLLEKAKQFAPTAARLAGQFFR